MSLPIIFDQHLKEVCQFGQGEKTCGYLTISAGGFYCAKGNAKLMADIKEAQPHMAAKGNNCSGPPDWKRTS